MTETSPLLPRISRTSFDLPIFFHVCHSSWPFLSQKTLFIVRAIIASFLTVVLALDILDAFRHTRKGKHFVFEAVNLSLMIQILYYWTTTFWTLQYCLAPHDRLPTNEKAKGKKLKARLLAPTSTDPNSKSCLIFAIFYTATATIPFVVSIAYWLVLYPSDPVFGQRSKDEPLHNFVLISITTLNSVIAFVEVMILSSVREQKDMAIQVACLIAMYLLYAIWTVFGCLITGEYVHKYFDPDHAGWSGVATTDITTVSLIVTIFLAQRGLQKTRELLAWKLKYPDENVEQGSISRE